MHMEISFAGGKRVNSSFEGFVVKTDQPVPDGGEGSAPAPFELFLASIGTCAGTYVLGFCQARNIPTEGVRLVQTNERNPQTGQLQRVQIDIQLPPGFPEKYRDAVRRAAELCAVKKAIQVPPEFVVSSEIMARA